MLLAIRAVADMVHLPTPSGTTLMVICALTSMAMSRPSRILSGHPDLVITAQPGASKKRRAECFG